MQYKRTGKFAVTASISSIFPLLCPKREEKWIPGWECEVIRSESGYNEENAIFKNTKAYGTELYWYTLAYDIKSRIVDFLITTPQKYFFRFKIDVCENDEADCVITFTHEFTSISDEGVFLIEQYMKEDLDARLKKLGEFMMLFLQGEKKKISNLKG